MTPYLFFIGAIITVYLTGFVFYKANKSKSGSLSGLMYSITGFILIIGIAVLFLIGIFTLPYSS